MAVLNPAAIGRVSAAGTDVPGIDSSERRARRRERLADLFARAVTCCLFVLLAVRIGREFLQTGHVTGLLLLVSEALVVLLTVARRRAVVVDRSWSARLVTTIAIIGVPFITPRGHAMAPDMMTASISAVGLLIIIVGKLTLGRSFGLMPANRGVVSSGVYGVVRHPIYMGYLITHIGFLAAHASLWNLVVLGVSDLALMVRAIYEERTLAKDPEYAHYMTGVRYRVCPGLF